MHNKYVTEDSHTVNIINRIIEQDGDILKKLLPLVYASQKIVT